MRRVLIVAIIFALAPLVMGGGPVQPNPRTCGGTTRVADFPCCVSGTVTLKGTPIEGATISVVTTKGTKTSDVTGYAPGDRYPTYGILLNGAELQARPGDVVKLTASYQDWSRTKIVTVEYGELWLDIELFSEPGPQR